MRECFGGFAGVRGANACGDALGRRISSPFVWTCSCALWADARCCCFAARGAVCTLRGCATLPLARMGNANACAGARRYRLRGWATLSLARMRDATACASARRCRLRGCATLSLARVRDATACANARRQRLRECATLSLARMRDAVACASVRRYRLRGCATPSLARVRDASRLRECFGRDAFVVVRTCTLACALSRWRALLLTARWLYAPWGEFATLPHARMRDAAACADGQRYRMRGWATLPLARVLWERCVRCRPYMHARVRFE